MGRGGEVKISLLRLAVRSAKRKMLIMQKSATSKYLVKCAACVCACASFVCVCVCWGGCDLIVDS